MQCTSNRKEKKNKLRGRRAGEVSVACGVAGPRGGDWLTRPPCDVTHTTTFLMHAQGVGWGEEEKRWKGKDKVPHIKDSGVRRVHAITVYGESRLDSLFLFFRCSVKFFGDARSGREGDTRRERDAAARR